MEYTNKLIDKIYNYKSITNTNKISKLLEIDANHGHFQSRKHYATRWDEINCQVQCAGCNVFKYGEQYVFSKNLNKKYGSHTSNRLYKKSQQIVKYTNYEIEDLINKYQSFVNLMD